MAGSDYYGKPFFSNPTTWAASSSQNFIPLDFMGAAVKGSQAPKISDMVLEVTVSGTTAASTGSARGAIFPQIFSQIQIKDKYGIRLDLDGASLRILNQQVYGTGLRYADAPNLGQGVTLTNFKFYVPIPTELPKMIKPQDFRWDAVDLWDGGQFLVSFAAAQLGASATANGFLVTAASVRLMIKVIDEGRDVSKMRTVARHVPFNNNQQAFPISPTGGRLLHAGQYIGPVGENKTPVPDTWTATQNIFSNGLNYPSIPAAYLDNQYLLHSYILQQDPAAVLGQLDAVQAGTFIPLWAPRVGQQAISECPDLVSLDWQTDQAFAGGTFIAADQPKMILYYVEDRTYGDGHLNSEPPAGTQLANGDVVPTSSIPASLRAKLPTMAAAPAQAASTSKLALASPYGQSPTAFRK